MIILFGDNFSPQRKLSIFYFISIIFDLCSTYFSTPDLSREGAWDFKILNIGWLGLISLSFLYFIITWVIFMYFNDKDRFPINIKSKKVRIWISRFTWMMIINFTIAYFLASFSNFLYCFENVEINNSVLHFIVSKHVNINHYLYNKYEIIYIDIISYISTIFVFFLIKRKIH